MRGSLPTVLDQTKRPAPGWRRNFDKQDGREHEHSTAVGTPGKTRSCRSYRKLLSISHAKAQSQQSRLRSFASLGSLRLCVRCIPVNKLRLTLILLIMISLLGSSANMQNRPRARELGITVGVLPT